MSSKAVLIGLGGIGAGYDSPLSKDFIFTHARALQEDENFTIIAGIDVDEVCRKKFSAQYGVNTFSSVVEAQKNISNSDLVVIATPTQHHLATMRDVLAWQPKLVLCEKPIAGSTAEAEELISLAENNNIALAVNYFRRFEPGVLRLKEQVQSGVFGKLLRATVYYSGGVKNNASHFIDLLQFLLDAGIPLSSLKTFGRSAKVGPSDCGVDFTASLGEAILFFATVSGASYDCLEADLFFSNARVKYENGGDKISIYSRISDPLFPGFFRLSEAPSNIETQFRVYQKHVYLALSGFLERATPFSSNAETAMSALRVADRVFQIAGGRHE